MQISAADFIENNMEFPQKIKIQDYHMIWKFQICVFIWERRLHPRFIALLFTTAKKWKQRKCHPWMKG